VTSISASREQTLKQLQHEINSLKRKLQELKGLRQSKFCMKKMSLANETFSNLEKESKK